MTNPRPYPDHGGWVTLEAGIQFSHRWLDERTPRLHAAWQRSRDDEQRRAIAARILQAAADSESETRTREHSEEPLTGDEWIAVADQVDPRLTRGRDWPLLAAALSRATDAGYDVEANLPLLADAAPLPDRHPARELQWRLLEDCEAAVPVLPPPPRTTEPTVIDQHWPPPRSTPEHLGPNR